MAFCSAAGAICRKRPLKRCAPLYDASIGTLTGPLTYKKDRAMTTPVRPLRSLLVAACILACAAPLVHAPAQAAAWGWGSDQVQGNGAIKRQQRELGHFTGVSNELSAKVEIHIGNTESVTIETDDNLLPLIDTSIDDGTLKIKTTKRGVNLNTRTLKIIVQAKSLDHISLGGSGTIESDPLRARKMQVDLGGSGTINLKGIEADAMSVNLGGSGDVKGMAGSASHLSISIGGSGNVKLGQVRSDTVSVTIAGSGDATVWARQTLSLTVAGSGDLNYYGDPRITTSVVGSGTTKRLGSAPQ